MRSKDKLPYLEWQEPDTGETVRLYADVHVKEGAQLPAVVTEHPVEEGSQITDHYRKDNETAHIEMYFSGSPLRGDLDDDFPGGRSAVKLDFSGAGTPSASAPIYTPGGISNAIGGAITTIGSAIFGGPPPFPTDVNALHFSAPPKTRFTAAIDTVRRLQSTGILVAAKCSLGRFEDLGITLAEPEKDEGTGNGGTLAFDFKQIRTVTSDIASALPIPQEPRGQKKGSSSKSGSEDADSEGGGSVGKSLLDSMGVTNSGSGR